MQYITLLWSSWRQFCVSKFISSRSTMQEVKALYLPSKKQGVCSPSSFFSFKAPLGSRAVVCMLPEWSPRCPGWQWCGLSCLLGFRTVTSHSPPFRRRTWTADLFVKCRLWRFFTLKLCLSRMSTFESLLITEKAVSKSLISIASVHATEPQH